MLINLDTIELFITEFIKIIFKMSKICNLNTLRLRLNHSKIIRFGSKLKNRNGFKWKFRCSIVNRYGLLDT